MLITSKIFMNKNPRATFLFGRDKDLQVSLAEIGR